MALDSVGANTPDYTLTFATIGASWLDLVLDPATTDEIAARLGWGSADTARQLAELELAGAVVRHCGAWLRV